MNEPAKSPPAKSAVSGCLVTIAVIAGLYFLGASRDKSSGGSGSGAAEKADLQVSGLDWKYSRGMRSAVGTVTNNGRKTYSYAQVEINVYDSSKTLIGSTMANVNNLSPGTSWRFEAPILEEGANEFRVVRVTGF